MNLFFRGIQPCSYISIACDLRLPPSLVASKTKFHFWFAIFSIISSLITRHCAIYFFRYAVYDENDCQQSIKEGAMRPNQLLTWFQAYRYDISMWQHFYRHFYQFFFRRLSNQRLLKIKIRFCQINSTTKLFIDVVVTEEWTNEHDESVWMWR